jgi:hypothetical protein
MPGTKTVKRLRAAADSADGVEARMLWDAANKIEGLIAALNNAKIAMNRNQADLMARAEQDINEALKSLDQNL